MKVWFQKNYKLVITLAFLVPIITVAIVSISHVTRWYGITNPLSWAIYLSVGIEIAALSSLAAISVDMGKKVYFPFGVATLIQFIGNVFFAYSFINTSSDMFKSWVELSSPLISLFGVDATDIIANKRFLAFFAGGMLPVISLSFLHMLIRFTEEENKKKLSEITEDNTPFVEPLITEQTSEITDPSFIMSELTRIRPTEEDLKKLEEILVPKSKDLVDEDIDFPDELEDLENQFEGNRDIDESELDEEIEMLIPEDEPQLFESVSSHLLEDDTPPVEESLWKQVMKKHKERIDNGETFEDEPTALANSGRTQMLDDSGFLLPVEAELIEKDYFLGSDPTISPVIDVLPETDDKKKILDPSNEEEINTLPINEDQSSLKLDKPASIIDHKIY